MNQTAVQKWVVWGGYRMHWMIILGIILGTWLHVSFWFWLTLSVSGLIVLWVFTHPYLWGWGVLTVVLAGSLWWGSTINMRYESIQQQVPDQMHDQVRIRSFPEETSQGFRYRVSIQEAFLYMTLESQYEYGEVVFVQSSVSIPEQPGIQRFLKGQNVHAYAFAEKEEYVRSDCFFVCYGYRAMYSVRQWMIDQLQIMYPRAGDFLQSILLGYRATLPEELETNFRQAGISHILAISGYHVSLVVVVLYRWLRNLYWPRIWVFPLASVGIVSFVILTGASASTMRAGIFALAILGAEFSGRFVAGIRPLIVCASGMLVFFPLFALYNVSFQFSFLAVCGIMTFSHVFRRFSQGMSSVRIGDLIGETLSAQLFVAPLLLFHFGQVSLIALFSNLIIVPFIPFIMAYGVLSVGVYQIIAHRMVGLPLEYLLDALFTVVRWLGSIPGAFLEIEISWLGLGTMYGVIGGIWIIYKLKTVV